MKDKDMIERVGALWNIALAYGASCWAYFQPVHHLLTVLLIVLIANFLARLAQSVRGWKLRRSKRWFREVRFTDILKEFALSCFIVMTLCVIYKTLYPIEEEASMILTVTKYGVYIALVGYVMLFLNTIGDAFSDAYLVKVFKAVFKRINVFKMFSFSKNIPDETFDDIRRIADDEVKDKS